MKIFPPPDVANILKSLNDVEKKQSNLSTNLPKTKFNNDSLKTASNLTQKMRVNHVEINKVILQAYNKLFVHIMLSAEI